MITAECFTKEDSRSYYFFDTLPNHPRPLPFESFTSYLGRVASLNNISNLSNLIKVFYPDSSTNFLRNLTDVPPTNFGNVSSATYTPQSDLLKTTFYHLLNKFGHATFPVVMAKFLSQSLSDHLRFCPQCLEQKAYYRLSWRFNVLLGCLEHGCRLAEKCGNCGQSVPLLSETLKPALCSQCQTELKATRVKRLLPVEKELVKTTAEALNFLLVPHPCENAVSSHLIRIGKWMRKARLQRQISIGQLTKLLGLKSGELVFIEDGRLKQGTASLRAYLGYANYLNLSLQTLFTDVMLG